MSFRDIRNKNPCERQRSLEFLERGRKFITRMTMQPCSRLLLVCAKPKPTGLTEIDPLIDRLRRTIADKHLSDQRRAKSGIAAAAFIVSLIRKTLIVYRREEKIEVIERQRCSYFQDVKLSY